MAAVAAVAAVVVAAGPPWGPTVPLAPCRAEPGAAWQLRLGDCASEM